MAVDACSPSAVYLNNFNDPIGDESKLYAADVLKGIKPYLHGATNAEKLLLQLFAIFTLKGIAAPNKEEQLSFMEEIIQTYDEVKGAASNLANKSNAIKMYCENIKRKYKQEIINLCADEIHHELQKNQDIESNIVKLTQDIKNLAKETLKLDVTGPDSQKNINDFRATLLINFTKLILVAAIFCVYTHSTHILVGPVLGMELNNPSNNTHRNREKHANRDASTRMQSIFAKHIPPLRDAYLRFAEALTAQHRAWMTRGTQTEAEVSGSEPQSGERGTFANQSAYVNLDSNGNVCDYKEEDRNINCVSSPSSNTSTPRPGGFAPIFATPDSAGAQSNHRVGHIAYPDSRSGMVPSTNNGVTGFYYLNHEQQLCIVPIEAIASILGSRQNQNNRRFRSQHEIWLLGLLSQLNLDNTGRAIFLNSQYSFTPTEQNTESSIQSRGAGPLIPYRASNMGNVSHFADRSPTLVKRGLGIEMGSAVIEEENTRSIHEWQKNAFERINNEADGEGSTRILLQAGIPNTQTEHPEYVEEGGDKALSPIPSDFSRADSHGHHFAQNIHASFDIRVADENGNSPGQGSLSSSISEASFFSVDISTETDAGTYPDFQNSDLAAAAQAQAENQSEDSEENSFVLIDNDNPTTTINTNAYAPHETQEERTKGIFSLATEIDANALTDALETEIVRTLPFDYSSPHHNDEDELNSTSSSVSNIYNNYAALEANISTAFQEEDKNNKLNEVDTQSVPPAPIDQEKSSSTGISDKELNTQEVQNAQRGGLTEAENLEQSVSTAAPSLKLNDASIQILGQSNTEITTDQSNTEEVHIPQEQTVPKNVQKTFSSNITLDKAHNAPIISTESDQSAGTQLEENNQEESLLSQKSNLMIEEEAISKKSLQNSQQVESDNLKESVPTVPHSLKFDKVFTQTTDQNINKKTPDQSNTAEFPAPLSQTGAPEKNSSAPNEKPNNSIFSVGSKSRTDTKQPIIPKILINNVDIDEEAAAKSSTPGYSGVSNKQDDMALNMGMLMIKPEQNKNNARAKNRSISAIPTANVDLQRTRSNASNIGTKPYERTNISTSSSEGDTSLEFKRKRLNEMRQNKFLKTAESLQGVEPPKGTNISIIDRRQSTVPDGKPIDAQINSTGGNNFATDTVLAFQASQNKTVSIEKTQQQVPFTVSRHVGKQQATQASSKAALNTGSLLENNTTESSNSKFSKKKERKPDKEKEITHTVTSNTNRASITSSPLVPTNKFGFGKKTNPIAPEKAPVSGTDFNQKTSVSRPPAVQSESNPEAFLNTQANRIENRHSSLSLEKKNKRQATASADVKNVKTETESTLASAVTNNDKKNSIGRTSIFSKPPTLEQTSQIARNSAPVGGILKTTIRFANASELETSNSAAQQAAQLQASAPAALVQKRSESRPSVGSLVRFNIPEEGIGNTGRTSASFQPSRITSKSYLIIEEGAARGASNNLDALNIEDKTRTITSNSRNSNKRIDLQALSIEEQAAWLNTNMHNIRSISFGSIKEKRSSHKNDKDLSNPSKTKNRKFVKRDYHKKDIEALPLGPTDQFNHNMNEVYNNPYTLDVEVGKGYPLVVEEISENDNLIEIFFDDPGIIFKSAEFVLYNNFNLLKKDKYASSDKIKILKVCLKEFREKYWEKYGKHNDKLFSIFNIRMGEITTVVNKLYEKRQREENKENYLLNI